MQVPPFPQGPPTQSLISAKAKDERRSHVRTRGRAKPGRPHQMCQNGISELKLSYDSETLLGS